MGRGSQALERDNACSCETMDNIYTGVYQTGG